MVWKSEIKSCLKRNQIKNKGSIDKNKASKLYTKFRKFFNRAKKKNYIVNVVLCFFCKHQYDYQTLTKRSCQQIVQNKRKKKQIEFFIFNSMKLKFITIFESINSMIQIKENSAKKK